MSSFLRFITEFGPLAVFFITYRVWGVMPATAAIMAATLLALATTYWKTRKIPIMPLVTGIAVTVFGGLTIYLNDEVFIKIKPTIINLLFASILLIGVFKRKGLLKYIFGYAVQMEGRGWWILSRRWGFFFLFLAGLNEAVWRNFSTDTWVDFKVFGMMAITFIFTLCQLPLMLRFAAQDPAEDDAQSPVS